MYVMNRKPTPDLTADLLRTTITLCLMLLLVFFAGCQQRHGSSPPPPPSTDNSGKTPNGGSAGSTDNGNVTGLPRHRGAKAAKKPSTAAKPAATPAAGGEGLQVPAFPWPPPEASAKQVLPADLLEKEDAPRSLANVNAKLVAALEPNGYVERSYYAVPNGFALVTRLEHIDADGKPKTDPSRWVVGNAALSSFNIVDFVHALVGSETGYYRVIVFIVTDVPFAESDKKVSSKEATEWLSAGLNTLPASIGDLPYIKNHVSTTVLIYEFNKDPGKDPEQKMPSRLGVLQHMKNSGIWQSLGGAI
jgi:hypothetical protein